MKPGDQIRPPIGLLILLMQDYYGSCTILSIVYTRCRCVTPVTITTPLSLGPNKTITASAGESAHKPKVINKANTLWGGVGWRGFFLCPARLGDFFVSLLMISPHEVTRSGGSHGTAAILSQRRRVTGSRFVTVNKDYESFIKAAILKHHITAIVTYNDTGERNRTAIKLATTMGLSRYIVEHGYLRPHWITFDRDGVNGHSTLPKEGAFYHNNNDGFETAQAFPCRMRDQVLSTIKHFGASIALYPWLPFDTTYYGNSVFTQGTGYVSEYLWRKTNDERKSVEDIVKHRRAGKQMFAVILQKPGDAQLRVHSSYGSNNPFLREACTSFAAFAPKDAVLVVKQHPLDYGVERTPRLFESLVRELKLEGPGLLLAKDKHRYRFGQHRRVCDCQ